MAATPVWSVDPRTGKQREQVAAEATPHDVDRAVTAGHAARGALADRPARTAFLRAAADLLDASAAEVVAAADAETALGTARLTGELARTTYQLRAFADAVEDGGYLDIRIDRADPALTPPRPELRRYKVPLGVVAVYAASNFPLAFSVPGGDTASALAAGCPVVVKAHPDHPATSALCASLLRRAAEQAGLPADVVAVVHGFDAGLELIRHPLVAAAGFTGSIRGGRALYDAAAARPVPIPFHGELGSLNPVVVTPAAAAERAEEIGAGLAGSVTLGVGQFCVKPGLVLVPLGADGDRLTDALAKALGATGPGVLLDHRMRENFLAGVRERAALPGVTAPVTPGPGTGPDGEHTVGAGFLTVPARRLAAEGPAQGSAEDREDGVAHDGEDQGKDHHDYEVLLEECFGPVTVVARYADQGEVGAVLARLPGNLSATLQLSDAETAGAPGPAAELIGQVTELAGRVVVNAWPTGVAVAPAQHHGGPYPAATSHSSSVGGTAIERWLRPVAYQSVPDALLPAELREANPLGLPRRVTP
ncbi:aldehyde dehydrogenase family protein [Streptomyces bambusae]|uniref:Aldehyde dehydrogenase family protein n=1 Tax=Streptomyces bambusae TaxID=1550616 RepID=A0ABS6ZDV0_9ACTN|nr:aldehyde dehydrogenase family protein [Streptomyces bambusae]MBW5485938.1 aldehyde dehydrogenase family protein [Streptomyces bambusae]